MNKLLAFIPIFLSLFLTDCENKIKTDCIGVLCTLEFRSIVVLIKHNSDNSPVVLTDYKVVRVSDNKDITNTDNNLNDNEGYYTVVNDSNLDLLRNNKFEVEFQGYINNALVIQKKFVVEADCCHVSLVSGDTVIFI